jgi:hypothetical protein
MYKHSSASEISDSLEGLPKLDRKVEVMVLLRRLTESCSDGFVTSRVVTLMYPSSSISDEADQSLELKQ